MMVCRSSNSGFGHSMLHGASKVCVSYSACLTRAIHLNWIALCHVGSAAAAIQFTITEWQSITDFIACFMPSRAGHTPALKI